MLHSSPGLERFRRPAPDDPPLDPAAPGARAVVFHGARLLIATDSFEPLVLDAQRVGGTLVPLGTDEGGRVYAVAPLDPQEAEEAILERLGLARSHASFAELRMELGRFDAPLREVLVTALAIVNWGSSTRFCSKCGHPVTWDFGAWTLSCSNPARAHRHFTRTDPATIMLVHRDDRVLLGRQPAWPKGRYSTLAGFIEPGESVEAAVVREVFEETGVHASQPTYFGSEAWPFPRSLMLGYFARAETTAISIDSELEDARWFTRDELRELLAMIQDGWPHFDTIARRLMRTWLERGPF